MMPRKLRSGYRPKAGMIEDAEEGNSWTADVIIEPDDDEEWIKSGLLDANGTPLYRRRERHRMGF